MDPKLAMLITALICFLIGAAKNYETKPSFISRVDWLCFGLAFLVMYLILGR